MSIRICFCILVAILAASSLHAQISGVTRRTVRSGAPPGFIGEMTKTTNTQQTYIVPVKVVTEEERRAIQQKTINFQTERAEAGAAESQYDLGMRYLKGDGLEKDPEKAAKWLKKAADQGHSQAKAALQTLASPQ
jgi:TPR repeat protein